MTLYQFPRVSELSGRHCTTVLLVKKSPHGRAFAAVTGFTCRDKKIPGAHQEEVRAGGEAQEEALQEQRLILLLVLCPSSIQQQYGQPGRQQCGRPERAAPRGLLHQGVERALQNSAPRAGSTIFIGYCDKTIIVHQRSKNDNFML